MDQETTGKVVYIKDSDLPEYEGYWLYPDGRRVYLYSPGIYEGSTIESNRPTSIQIGVKDE